MHVAMFIDASLAVHVTVVMPTGKQVPEGGEHIAVGFIQLSEGVGVV